MIRFDPAVPRIGAGIAALAMSALTFGLMVILPSELEQKSSVLAIRAEAHRAAASPGSERAQLRPAASDYHPDGHPIERERSGSRRSNG